MLIMVPLHTFMKQSLECPKNGVHRPKGERYVLSPIIASTPEFKRSTAMLVIGSKAIHVLVESGSSFQFYPFSPSIQIIQCSIKVCREADK